MIHPDLPLDMDYSDKANEYQKKSSYRTIPLNTIETLIAYAHSGQPTGHFLRAVLSNDLFDAFARADTWNRDAMHPIVIFIYNEIPGDSWGSREVVKGWIEQHKKEREKANV